MRKPKPIESVPDTNPSVRRERPARPELRKPMPEDEKNLSLTPEERAEWEKYQIDLREYLDASFNMRMLQDIALREGGPAFQESPAAREIVRSIAECMQIRSDPSLSKTQKYMKGRDPLRQEWQAVRRLVAARVLDEQEGRASLQKSYEGAVDKGDDAEKVRRMHGLMASSAFGQLKDFLVAMDRIEGFLFSVLRAPGKRDAALIFDRDLPLRLSNLLSKAWFEAGMKSASKEKIYRIVRELLICAGDKAVTVAGVKSAILRRQTHDRNLP